MQIHVESIPAGRKPPMTALRRIGPWLLSLSAMALLGACADRELPTTLPLGVPAYTQSPSAPVVNSLNDPGTDGCTPEECTLREAISYAVPGATITFAPELTAHGPATITLAPIPPGSTWPPPGGALLVWRHVTIEGPGADRLTVRRDTTEGMQEFRVFSILETATVSMSGLTITGGNVRSFGGGGGGVYIYSGANATLSDLTVSHNTAHVGGGIHNRGNLTLRNSTVSHNVASTGGGITASTTADLITQTTTIINSTISHNSATITGGGGIYADLGLTRISNTTITGNRSQAGGGVMSRGDERTRVTVKNSIIWGNTLQDGSTRIDVSSGTPVVNRYNSLGHNLIGAAGEQVDFAFEFDQKGDAVGLPAGAWLGPLTLHAPGTTATHALLPGSPAIDLGSCTDHAGNPVTADQRGILRPQGGNCDIGAFESEVPSDDTPPDITATITGTLGKNGWYTSDVTVSWTVTDEESDITETQGCAATTLTSDTDGTTFVCTASSAGGTAADTVIIKRDATPPIIDVASRTPEANDNGWNNADVTVTWTCTDAGSGPVSGSVSEKVTSEGADQSVTGTCTDQAGNTATDTRSGINIDRTPPSLDPSVSLDPVLLGGSVTATANASDALSGIASQSCEPANTGNVGSQTLNCTATDNAGNTAEAAVTYQVSYTFIGFDAPVRNDQVNVAKAGQAIPLKWRLLDSQGNPVTTLSSVQVSFQVESCEGGTPIDTIPVDSPGASGFKNQGNGRYQFNWKTSSSLANQCGTLHVDLGEGITRTASFRFSR